MVENRYTTKIRAKRIELDYFKRLHPFRRWKLILSVAAPLAAAAWLVAYASRGDQRIYTSGPLSTAHTMFQTQCSECHAPSSRTAGSPGRPRTSGFFLKVSDTTCVTCHDGPIHHDGQTFNPTCASCHVEHKGHVVLATLKDAHCTQCHADLRTRSGTPPPFATTIRSFSSGHPEFAVAIREKATTRRVRLDRTDELKDTAQIKLNHQKHLKIGLKGLEELKVLRGPRGLITKQGRLGLSCTFCHEPDASRVSMQPISYDRHCGPGCHPLDVDARLPAAVAPHNTPEIVHAYLRTLFIEAFEECQALPRDAMTGGRAQNKLTKECQDLELVKAEATQQARGGRRPGGTPDEAPTEQPRGGRLRRAEPAEEATTDRPRGLRARAEDAETKAAPGRWGPAALEWAAAQLQGAEKVMFKQKCEFCHVLTHVPDRPPLVAPTAIPARWLPHGVFDHGAHRPIGCAECHKALVSKETTDVLLPSVNVCRECHHAGGGARTGCVECHRYHDKTKERDWDGPFAIRRLGGIPPPSVNAVK